MKGLSGTLARLDGRNSAEFIIEKLALPQQWDQWTRADVIEALLFSGAPLPAKRILEVLNPVIAHALIDIGGGSVGYWLLRDPGTEAAAQPLSSGAA